MTIARIQISGRDRARRSDAALALPRLAVMAILLAPAGVARLGEAADQPAASRGRIVDPAVVPAGAMPCTRCGPACGGHGGGLHGHHAGCREGNCVPYCPVRPDRYGYYGTQWRRWPGQQVMQVSNDQAATPVKPPRSEVPGPNEESMGPQADDLPAPAPEAAAPLTAPAPDLLPPRPAETQPMPAARQPEPQQPAVPEQTPQPAPAPAPAPDPAPEPAPEPAVKPAPTPTPAEPRPEDENLFEAESGWKAKRKFAVARHDADVRPAGHSARAAGRLVPRVPFDATAEARNVRAAGGR
jgi:hypothetical protein